MDELGDIRVGSSISDEQLIEPLKTALELRKYDYDEYKDKIHAVIYTDGGALLTPVKTSGIGVHGYFYLDEPTKSNSSSPKGYATKNGYTLTKIVEPNYKVDVLTYFDYRRGVNDTTMNYAELSAGIVALEILQRLQVKEFKVLSDSEYFVKNLNEHLERWVANDFISNNKPLANKGLWLRLHTLWGDTKGYGTVRWIKAHSADVGNDYADLNATMSINMSLHPNYDGSDDFVHDIPSVFWDRGHQMSPLFTERRLILHSDGNDGNIYFQMSMGSHWPTTESDRLKSIGKRIADTCISVVLLDEPEPVIDMISDYCRDVSNMTGLVCGRLDLLTQGSLYNQIKTTKTLTLRSDGKAIKAPTGVQILNELKPARLSWRIAQQFEWVADNLVQFVKYYGTDEQSKLYFNVIEITDGIFNFKDSKKGVVYELDKQAELDEIIHLDTVMNDTHTTLTLTMNIDLPSKMDLKRMAKHNPLVYLLYWSDHYKDDLIYYATVFKIGEQYGIWVAAYCNFHLLSHS